MKFGVVVFPGSNCDRDCAHAVKTLFGEPARILWHGETDLSGLDCIVLPGGFSYGDYLRTGAIARFSPVMASVQEFARAGGLVVGICNGFQILCEAHLLPGALIQNAGLRFICRQVHVRVETNDTPFTRACRPGEVLRIPIAHHSGRYFCDEATLRTLEETGQILLRYCDRDGNVVPEANPNGSAHGIAGVCNLGRNVFGVMPHPERAIEAVLGSIDGARLLESLIAA